MESLVRKIEYTLKLSKFSRNIFVIFVLKCIKSEERHFKNAL